MISRGLQRPLRVALALAVFLAEAPLRADPEDPTEVEAHRLVHILGYIGGDYPRAITDGRVASWDEYEEQRELGEEADRIAAGLELAANAAGRRADLMGPIGEVRALVDDKASAQEVTTAAADAAARTVRAFHLGQAPATRPDATRGEALFAEHCAPCHGATGHADGARAASLTPRPANFHAADVADAMTPYRVASTIRFGVAGTAMVPFTFLSDAERWDLAFHVVALRHTAAPSRESPVYSGAELATLSDAALRADLAATGVAPEKHAAILADLRRRAPFDDRGIPAEVAPPADPPSASSIRLQIARLALAVLAVLAWAGSPRAATPERSSARADEPKRSVYGRVAIALLAAAALIFAIAPERSPLRFSGSEAASPASGPFSVTLRVRGPSEVQSGYARLHTTAGFDRTVRFGPGNDALISDLPASLRETGAKISVVTTPELEPTWPPDRVFPLHRDVLELRMMAERPRYEVVLLRRKEPGSAVEALRLPGFNVGDEVDVATFTSRAIMGLRVLHPELPAPGRFSALSRTHARWLKPATSLEHLDFEETVIVLVDADVRADLGEDPTPYLDLASRALGAP